MKRELFKGWKYVIVTYLVFAGMVLGICGVASMVFHAGPVVMRILSNVCAWSPTIVLLMGFRYWCPDIGVSEYIKNMFSHRIKLHILVISAASTGLTFMLTALIYAIVKEKSFISLFSAGGTSVLLHILFSILSGPTGEELGWRGYLRVKFENRYGFIKGNLLVGLVWTFWHGVLWVVDNEYTSGMDLFIYIISNIVVITSIHLIMAVIMEEENNIIYSIVIHLFFNLPYCFLTADITFYLIMIPLYVCAASLFLFIRNMKKRLNGSKHSSLH